MTLAQGRHGDRRLVLMATSPGAGSASKVDFYDVGGACLPALSKRENGGCVMVLYLGRHTTGDKTYELGTSATDWSLRTGFDSSFVMSFCPEEFEEFTNVKLAPGELVKVESIKFKLRPIKG